MQVANEWQEMDRARRHDVLAGDIEQVRSNVVVLLSSTLCGRAMLNVLCV